MPEILTKAEIDRRFDSEWVLVGDPVTDEFLEVHSGTVLAHSKDRDEVYRCAVETRPARFAILYNGRMRPNTAIWL